VCILRHWSLIGAALKFDKLLKLLWDALLASEELRGPVVLWTPQGVSLGVLCKFARALVDPAGTATRFGASDVPLGLRKTSLQIFPAAVRMMYELRGLRMSAGVLADLQEFLNSNVRPFLRAVVRRAPGSLPHRASAMTQLPLLAMPAMSLSACGWVESLNLSLVQSVLAPVFAEAFGRRVEHLRTAIVSDVTMTRVQVGSSWCFLVKLRQPRNKPADSAVEDAAASHTVQYRAGDSAEMTAQKMCMDIGVLLLLMRFLRGMLPHACFGAALVEPDAILEERAAEPLFVRLDSWGAPQPWP
jgi:hypothetical protein